MACGLLPPASSPNQFPATLPVLGPLHVLFPLLEEARSHSLGLHVSFSERRPLTPILVTGGLLLIRLLTRLLAQTSQEGGGSVHRSPAAHSSLSK